MFPIYIIDGALAHDYISLLLQKCTDFYYNNDEEDNTIYVEWISACYFIYGTNIVNFINVNFLFKR